MKRSTKVVLASTGTAALAGYMATRQPKCDPNDPLRTEPCPVSSSSRSSSSGWRSSSSRSASSRSTQSVVSRGGFGSTGSSISSSGG